MTKKLIYTEKEKCTISVNQFYIDKQLEPLILLSHHTILLSVSTNFTLTKQLEPLILHNQRFVYYVNKRRFTLTIYDH